jgi:hypothetical protein
MTAFMISLAHILEYQHLMFAVEDGLFPLGSQGGYWDNDNNNNNNNNNNNTISQFSPSMTPRGNRGNDMVSRSSGRTRAVSTKVSVDRPC